MPYISGRAGFGVGPRHQESTLSSVVLPVVGTMHLKKPSKDRVLLPEHGRADEPQLSPRRQDSLHETPDQALLVPHRSCSPPLLS